MQCAITTVFLQREHREQRSHTLLLDSFIVICNMRVLLTISSLSSGNAVLKQQFYSFNTASYVVNKYSKCCYLTNIYGMLPYDKTFVKRVPKPFSWKKALVITEGSS